MSKFPKRPVQAKPQRSRVEKWLIGCGCIAPLGLFVLVVLFGAVGQIFDPGWKTKGVNGEASAQEREAVRAVLEAQKRARHENAAERAAERATAPVKTAQEQGYGAIAQQVQANHPNKTSCELAAVDFLEASIRMNKASQSGNEAEFDKWYTEMNRRADKQLEVCK